ncbi:2-keto-4-pentenoate hydratase/2-oxohepta-3-ene-1,7-dioic acid hydratase in catechol pathway [Blastococcus colisei]|uniref:2-keto-4-pentenoate hydratase/2-oxohepta-3-ene-1,7-dioic acid hydratase in catechol pathway n=1 Tax=Blastococcus colisei TaxID=1564162 RepID=A0A543PA79_9ACTN|nr:fumarylacetoacetate hydrolase family protein [Blastococcus colisei]TQN40994.1 2-keto-4-pentenoate hydratase/2-oxohepta-3-ene-1,7-dioic acid hydratase in catechol pathway [Blastococcus colisei]
MRFATYVSPRDGTDHVALVKDGALHGLPDRRLIDVLSPERLADAADRAIRAPVEVLPEGSVRLRAPVPQPPSVRDFMAFEQHVVTASAALGREVNPDWYELPVFYFTNPAAVCGPTDPVAVSPGSSAFDYELEIGIVVGAAGRDLDPACAESHVAGYTVLCDWSARDLQAREMALGLGPVKGKDGATSLGPYLVTPDELPDRGAGNAPDVGMRALVNGELWSEGRFSDLHWTVGQLLAYASRGTALRPGDVLGTGTVGTGCILELSAVHGAETRPWLRPGDRVRLEVDLLGAVETTIQPAPPVRPLH